MIVIIANKAKDDIENSSIKEQSYKCANGYFSAQNCADNIRDLEIDKLIIDITAIRDIYEIGSWKHFKEIIDSSNIYVLLDNNKSYSNVGFLSMLITMGIYNFANTTSELIRLLEVPNTYSDVEKYHKMAIIADEKKENAEVNIKDYELKTIKQQEMMQEYMRKYQNGDFKEQKKPEVFKDQLITGFILLPLLAFISTMIFYFLEILIYNNIGPETYVGKYLYTNILNSSYNPIVAIGGLITALIFAIYYNVLDSKIKRKQMTRGKFMIIPIGIFCSIIIGDYYLFEIAKNLFNKIPLIADVDYLYQNFYEFNMLVVAIGIFIYALKVAIANSKVLRFEIDLSQSFSILEKILVISIALILILPFSYWVSINIANNSGIYEFLYKIHEQPFIMAVLSIITIALTTILIINTILYPNKEVVIKEKEEF